MGTENIRNIMLGITFFTFFIVGGLALVSNLKANYDNTMMSDQELQSFNSTFNRYTELTDKVDSLSAQLNSTENTDFGTFGVLNSLINSAWQTLRLSVTGISFMTGALLGLNDFFGVPNWAILLCIMMLTIVIVYSIYEAIFQR